VALAAALAGLLAVPAVGWAAGSGGSGIGPSGDKQAQSANGTVSSTVHGVTITTHASGFDNQTMKFVGSVSRRHVGQKVVIERDGRQAGNWVTTATATVARNGSFEATWNATQTGPFAIRAVLPGARAANAASTWPTVNVIVYRPGLATIYGPGFWGNRTACGETLRHKTLGVANRTLPCGTKVSIYYGGRSIVVPVIDRGPYANGAKWDITMATAKALQMPGTETVGSARLS
jgi:rare lipoprotein A